MKGYNTSKDYNLLWDLIREGYEIFGMNKFKEPICVYQQSGRNNIMTKGLFFGLGNIAKNRFIATCESIDLEFIPPTNTETE